MQNKEFSDGSGLEAYDFNARMYDPQIGRMWQVDPWIEKYERQSPYVGFNDNPIVFDDPTGKGGELTVCQREDGSYYLKVSSKIYVYSSKMSKDEAKKYASKIQSDIMSQWNNPTETDANGNPVDGAKGYGQIGKDKVDVVFDVSVEAVTTEEAEGLAKDNKDVSVNFMSLDGTGTSHVDGNSGEFNIEQLNDPQKGSSTAAHEYGHMLGYYIDKKHRDGNYYPATDGFNTHAWKNQGEDYFIMGGYSGDQSKRRVDPIEYTRLNGGIERREKEGAGGLYTPTYTTNYVPIVNPKKPLTNTIYK